MEPIAVLLALFAGMLSIFSPCVLPLLPIVLGTAVTEHRWGPVALAVGLALSFMATGLLVATIGFAIGLNAELLRKLGAATLLALGVILIVPALQQRLSVVLEPLTAGVRGQLGKRRAGLPGQFGLGVLLGMVWTPCVGPTLGAASVLAAQGRDLVQVGVTMFSFAVGTAAPLLIVGLFSRELLLRWRGRMMVTGQIGKTVLGVFAAASGILILTNYDRWVEAAMLELMPSWMSSLGGTY